MDRRRQKLIRALLASLALLALLDKTLVYAESSAANTRAAPASWPKASQAAVALVRLMREDEVILMLSGQAAAKDKLKSRCVARLPLAELTETIGEAITVALSAEEIEEAVSFFQTDAGRKFTEIKYVQLRDELQPSDPRLHTLSVPEELALAEFVKRPAGRKLIREHATLHSTVKGEVFDYIVHCEQLLTGQAPATFCRSEPVVTADQTCSASYSVTQSAGEDARHTLVDVSCDDGKVASRALIAEFVGQHETIGLAWQDDHTLEVLLPPGIKTVRKDLASHYDGPKQKYLYRARKPTDAPAASCVRQPDFIDPGKND